MIQILVIIYLENIFQLFFQSVQRIHILSLIFLIPRGGPRSNHNLFNNTKVKEILAKQKTYY